MSTPPMLNFYAAAAHYGISCFMLVTLINQFDILGPKPPIPGYDNGFLGFFLGAWTIGVFALWGPVIMGGMKTFDDYSQEEAGFFAAPSFSFIYKHVFAVFGAAFLTFGAVGFATGDGLPPFGNASISALPVLLVVADYCNIFAALSLFIAFTLICGSEVGTFGKWNLFQSPGGPPTGLGSVMLMTMKAEGIFFMVAGLCLASFMSQIGNVTGVILQVIVAFGGFFFWMSGSGVPGAIISLKYTLPCLVATSETAPEEVDLEKPTEPLVAQKPLEPESKLSKSDVEMADQSFSGSEARLSKNSAATPLVGETRVSQTSAIAEPAVAEPAAA